MRIESGNFAHLTIVFSCCILAFADAGHAYAQDIIGRAILERSRTGEVTKLSDLVSAPVNFVCILQPYQNALQTDDAAARLSNQYLRATNYRGDEGHWAFVFVGQGSVEVQRIARSRRLDIAEGHPDLPLSFRAAECVSTASGGILKLKALERPVLILGETR